MHGWYAYRHMSAYILLVLFLWGTLTEPGGMWKGLKVRNSWDHVRCWRRPCGLNAVMVAQGASGKVSRVMQGFGSHVKNYMFYSHIKNYMFYYQLKRSHQRVFIVDLYNVLPTHMLLLAVANCCLNSHKTPKTSLKQCLMLAISRQLGNLLDPGRLQVTSAGGLLVHLDCSVGSHSSDQETALSSPETSSSLPLELHRFTPYSPAISCSPTSWQAWVLEARDRDPMTVIVFHLISRWCHLYLSHTTESCQ